MDDPNHKDAPNPVLVAQTAEAALPTGLVPTTPREHDRRFARRQALRQPNCPVPPLVEPAEPSRVKTTPAKPVLFGPRALI